MCKIIETVYQECNHLKSYTLIPNGACQHYRPSSSSTLSPNSTSNTTPSPSDPSIFTQGGHCTGSSLDIVHTNIVEAPLLCVDCFRAEEELIDEGHDHMIASLERDVQSLKRCKVEEEGWALKQLELALERYEGHIGWVRGEKRRDIEEFRRGQGVWGDG